MAKKERNPTVRLNMMLEGEPAKVLIDMKAKKIISNNAEGVRLVFNKYLETLNRPVLVVKVEGIKMEEEKP